jgi:ankyrin repeat protein
LKEKITNSDDKKQTEIFQNLLHFFQEEERKKACLEKVSVWKEEPMMKAIRKNYFKFFSLLVFLGGQLEETDLEYLVNKIENESEIFVHERYLTKCFLSKIRDQYEQTLIHHAAVKGKPKCLKILIGCKLSDVNIKKADRELNSCCFPECAISLIRNKSSVNVYNIQRKTPVHLAARKGHQECLELLIIKGGDVNAKDEDDRTPLHSAAGSGEVNCLKVLLANGADVNAEDEDDWTPLHWAAGHGNVDSLEVLLANGADVNARDIKQNSPLHIIGFSSKGNKEEKERSVEMLINAGADVDAKEQNDWTPLHIAAFHGNVNCLEVLLANGADVNASDNTQNTPLHMIGLSPKGSKEEKKKCAKMLIKAGAVIDAEDEDGDTIFAYPFFQTLRVERPDLFKQN